MTSTIGGTLRRRSAFTLPALLVALVGCGDDSVAVTEPAFGTLQAAVAEASWPDAILIPTGFEPEGIELGKGHEFFVGANSLASLFGAAFFGIPHELSGFAQIEGAEQVFPNNDGLYLEGRTLYILQNFANKIAVVQLSGDLTGGRFIRNIPGEGEANPLNIATTLTQL